MKKVEPESVEFENIIVVPPDGGWGWVVVLAAFYCIFVMDGIANTYGVLIPVFQKEFNATISQLSLINSIFTGFYFFFGPLASALSNRFGFRIIIVTGSIVAAFGIGISILNTSVTVMYITYGFIGGLGFSFMYINVVLTVGFYFERWRALATGITVSASGVGTFSFAPAVQALLQIYTWKHILVGYAVLVSLCSAVALCFRPLTPIHIKMDEESDVKPKEMGKKVLSNVNYPTSANMAIHSHHSSKISVISHGVSSIESFEVHVKDSWRSAVADLSQQDTKNRCYKCKLCCLKCRYCCRRKRGLRPLYRDDIFYEGSLYGLATQDVSNLPLKMVSSVMTGRTSRISNRTLFYTMSVSRLPTKEDIKEEQDRKCHCCPESVTRVLKTMFDLSIIKKRDYMYFLTSTSIVCLGALVPVQFSYVRAVDREIMDQSEASLMLSTIGITNTIGRIVCGLLASIPRLNIVLFHTLTLLFGAFLNTAFVFFKDKTALFIYAGLYGFVLAEMGCLRSVILVKLVGLENLTNAFGILLLFLGVFTIIGNPLAGVIQEATGTYDSVFYYSSLVLLLSAATVAPILSWKKCEKRQRSTTVQAPD